MKHVVALLLCLATTPALADDKASAKQHYLEGTKAFDLGLYDKAITEYMAAYQAKNDPALLYNIAQAHRLAGHLKEAHRFYRVYLQRLPNAENRVEVENKLVELKQAIDQQEAATNRLPPDHPLAPKETPEQPAPPPTTPAPTPAPAPAPVVVEKPAATSHPGRDKRIAGLATGGVGIGAVAVGIAFLALAQQASDDLTTASQMGGFYDPARYSAGQTDQIVGGVMLGIGAAAVVTGVVLYVIGHREGKRAPALAWQR